MGLFLFVRAVILLVTFRCRSGKSIFPTLTFESLENLFWFPIFLSIKGARKKSTIAISARAKNGEEQSTTLLNPTTTTACIV